MFNTTKTKIDNGPEEKKCEKLRGTNQSGEIVIYADGVRYLLTFIVTGRRDENYIISALSLKKAGQNGNTLEEVEFLNVKNFLYCPSKMEIMEYGGY